MKRMHIHIGVDHLDQAIAFYSALFGAQPAKLKTDYAKWMLDDPCVNFAISTGAARGVEHLGIQVDNPQALSAMRDRLKAADLTLFDEGETVCCYVQSDKSWVEDPAGVAWEAFQTMGDAAYFHSHERKSEAAACCGPVTRKTDLAQAPNHAGNAE